MIAKRIIVPAAVAAALAVGGTVGLAATASAAPFTSSAQSQSGSQTSHAGAAWLRHHRKAIRRTVVTVSSKDIGVTRQDLVRELRSGKSIAQVAGEHGANVATIESDLVRAADNAVNTLESKGTLTSAQASKIEAALPGLATKVVNRTF